MSSVFIFFGPEGIEFGASEGVKVVCIDPSAPNDRVYVLIGKLTQDEFDLEVDRWLRALAMSTLGPITEERLT